MDWLPFRVSSKILLSPKVSEWQLAIPCSRSPWRCHPRHCKLTNFRRSGNIRTLFYYDVLLYDRGGQIYKNNSKIGGHAGSSLDMFITQLITCRISKSYLVNVCQKFFSAMIFLFLNIVTDRLEVHRPFDLVQIVRHFFRIDRLPKLGGFLHDAKFAQDLEMLKVYLHMFLLTMSLESPLSTMVPN